VVIIRCEIIQRHRGLEISAKAVEAHCCSSDLASYVLQTSSSRSASKSGTKFRCLRRLQFSKFEHLSSCCHCPVERQGKALVNLKYVPSPAPLNELLALHHSHQPHCSSYELSCSETCVDLGSVRIPDWLIGASARW
jgi:hypothetical protein